MIRNTSLRLLFLSLILISQFIFAQNNLYAQKNQNWHWKDFAQDTLHGISLHKAYQKISTLHTKATPIVVAVLDGGIDTNHISLQKVLWHNLAEIPNNNIDDDHNGYVDDYYGWNFLGGRDGQNIDKAAAEKSRIYHQYKNKYENKNIDTLTLSVVEKKQYLMWKRTAAEIETSPEDAANLQYIKMATNALKKIAISILKEMGDSSFTVTQLENYEPLGRNTLDSKNAYLRTVRILGIEREMSYLDVIKDLNEYIEGKEIAANAKEQAPSAIRESIIKDNYFDFADSHYGNKDVTGPNARHGTHVAGLVASIPDSNWQINNLYPPIQIMSVRVVPDGDEYDKDIALGIRYAVDNGAKIINMSFGKSYSPEQIWVDSAIRYAASKDVLIIHSAGNEFYDLDQKEVFPTPYSSSLHNKVDNVITVAASSDPIIGSSLLTDFTNYGAKFVDVLAPGDKIYSTVPSGNKYAFISGTSMSAPIVSHIAAMIRSYFPQLTAVEVKTILLNSVWKPNNANEKNAIPNRDLSKSLLEICNTGGIVNASNALDMAIEVAKNSSPKNVAKSAKKKKNN